MGNNRTNDLIFKLINSKEEKRIERDCAITKGLRDNSPKFNISTNDHLGSDSK